MLGDRGTAEVAVRVAAAGARPASPGGRVAEIWGVLGSRGAHRPRPRAPPPSRPPASPGRRGRGRAQGRAPAEGPSGFQEVGSPRPPVCASLRPGPPALRPKFCRAARAGRVASRRKGRGVRGSGHTRPPGSGRASRRSGGAGPKPPELSAFPGGLPLPSPGAGGPSAGPRGARACGRRPTCLHGPPAAPAPRAGPAPLWPRLGFPGAGRAAG